MDSPRFTSSSTAIAPNRLPRAAAAGAALGAYVVPLLLSRSTSPTPDHPRILLWYEALRMPPYKPPDVAIPIAWTAIETTLALAAYRLLRQPPERARNRALAWLGANIVGIGAWNRVFFGQRSLPISTVAAAALVGTAGAYIAQARPVDRVSAAAGIPLVAWLAFATVLTGDIWRRNR